MECDAVAYDEIIIIVSDIESISLVLFLFRHWFYSVFLCSLNYNFLFQKIVNTDYILTVV